MTKNSAEKRAARAYLAENPSLTYHQALQHIRKVHEENMIQPSKLCGHPFIEDMGEKWTFCEDVGCDGQAREVESKQQ